MPLTFTDSPLYYKDSQGNYQRILSGADMTGYRTAVAQDVIDAGKEASGLGLTDASVGDLVRVNSVDSNGKPTSWKKVQLNEIKCNKNMLDNWYFVGGGSQLGDGVFPINQRGQTIYGHVSAPYGINRWKSSSIEVTEPYIRTSNIIQVFDYSEYVGQKMTGSVLYSDGRLLTGTAIVQPVEDNTVFHNDDEGNLIRLSNYWKGFQIATTDSTTRDIIAVKLELGSEQTLAHNEGTEQNPVWVLNEIPDYGEELLKCQTSRADSTDTYANQEIAIINRNAGAHNGIYRGKYLGSSVTAEQYAAINAGTFEDLYIGDYWTIGGVNYRIAAFDYWLHCGDQYWNDGNGNYTVSFESTHHIIIVPDTCLYSAQMHNTTSGASTEGAANNPVTGAYVGSDMYKTNLAQAKTTIINAFGAAHILNHREYLKNAVNGAFESSGAWYDSTVELMNEQMVYGGKIFANCMQAGNFAAQYTIDKSQLPLFALEPSRICNRTPWWLRDVASSTYFARVTGRGVVDAVNSSDLDGVRPAFGIKA